METCDDKFHTELDTPWSNLTKRDDTGQNKLPEPVYENGTIYSHVNAC